MPFYLVEQKGVPGKRLVEATKPAGALDHVISDSFTVKRVTDRELIDLVRELGNVEVAGTPAAAPATEEKQEGGVPATGIQTGDGSDPDFIAGQGQREEDEE